MFHATARSYVKVDHIAIKSWEKERSSMHQKKGWSSKFSVVWASCLVLIIFAGTTQAAFVPLTAPATLADINAGTGEVVAGDKVFSDFAVLGSATGGALVLDETAITVQGGYEDTTNDYGLRVILSGFSAGSDQSSNINLSFQVNVAQPGWLVTEVFLSTFGNVEIGTGTYSIGETVLADNNVQSPVILAQLGVARDPEFDASFDSAVLSTPDDEIFIRKDLSVTGGTDGAAHISEMYQFFSQVPEPGSLALIGTASLLIFARRRQRIESNN